jgi:hypothetical protein
MRHASSPAAGGGSPNSSSSTADAFAPATAAVGMLQSVPNQPWAHLQKPKKQAPFAPVHWLGQ